MVPVSSMDHTGNRSSSGDRFGRGRSCVPVPSSFPPPPNQHRPAERANRALTVHLFGSVVFAFSFSRFPE